MGWGDIFKGAATGGLLGTVTGLGAQNLGPLGALGGLVGGFGGNGNNYQSPDYLGAAREQGIQNRESALASAKLSNPWMTTPYGTRQIDYSGKMTGDPLIPYITDQLTALGQERQSQQERINSGLGNIAEGGLGRIGQAFSTPLSVGNVDELQNKAENAMMARLNPIWDRRDEQTRSRLASQGIPVGSEAYTNEMQDFGMQRNDAESQAILAAMQQRPQALQEELAIRNVPLNETNALLSGSQVTNPQFQQYTGQDIQASPLFQATQMQGQDALSQYNANLAYKSALINGLLGAGGKIGGAFIGG